MRVAVHPDAAQPDDQIIFKVVYRCKCDTDRDVDGNIVEDDGTTKIDRRIM